MFHFRPHKIKYLFLRRPNIGWGFLNRCGYGCGCRHGHCFALIRKFMEALKIVGGGSEKQVFSLEEVFVQGGGIFKYTVTEVPTKEGRGTT